MLFSGLQTKLQYWTDHQQTLGLKGISPYQWCLLAGSYFHDKVFSHSHVMVCSDQDEAEDVYEAVKHLKNVHFYPGHNHSLYSSIQTSESSLLARWSVLQRLVRGEKIIVVTTWEAALMLGPDPQFFKEKSFSLKKHSFSEAYAAHPITAAMFLFPLIGLVMLYHTVAIWVNKTQMQIDAGEFVIKKGPLFWMPSEFKIPVSDIKQAYVQEYSAYVENKQPIIRYRLMVQRFSSGDAQIESGITDYSDALILEKWLEENIGIQNVSVPGEVGFNKAS